MHLNGISALIRGSSVSSTDKILSVSVVCKVRSQGSQKTGIPFENILAVVPYSTKLLDGYHCALIGFAADIEYYLLASAPV